MDAGVLFIYTAILAYQDYRERSDYNAVRSNYHEAYQLSTTQVGSDTVRILTIFLTGITCTISKLILYLLAITYKLIKMENTLQDIRKINIHVY